VGFGGGLGRCQGYEGRSHWMDARAVGGLCHFPAQRVKLPHQMALARAADGGVSSGPVL